MRTLAAVCLLTSVCMAGEPEEAVRQFLTALGRGDREATGKWLAKDAIFYSAGGSTTPPVLQVGARLWNLYRNRITFIRHITHPTPDTGLAVVIWKNPTAQPPDNTGLYDIVLRREADAWKVFTLRSGYGQSLPTVPVTHRSSPDSDGWKTLFDGKSIAGWTTFAGETKLPDGWKIEDGSLIAVQGPSGQRISLRSEEEFTEFDLRWQWKAEKAANSGVLYLLMATSGFGGADGLEYQLADDDGERGAMVDARQKSGALYGTIPVAVSAVRPLGEWNDSRIVLRGTRLEHWLNDVRTAEYELDGIFSSPISLQHHGPGIAFRNIRIRPLAAN